MTGFEIRRGSLLPLREETTGHWYCRRNPQSCAAWWGVQVEECHWERYRRRVDHFHLLIYNM